MRNFFGWQERCPRMAVDSWPSEPDAPPAQTMHEMLQCLSRLCQGADAHPFVRPLGKTFIQLGEAANGGARMQCTDSSLSAALESALAASIEFLSPSETPARHLEFALNAHKEKVATDAFIHTITDVCSPELYSHWLESAQEFVARCQEVWELHAYFVFLDIKGDRVLFEQTAHQLCRALGCSMRSFVGCLAHSRPWAEDMLQALAQQDLRALLERLHEDALRKWRTTWEERIRSAPERSRVLEEPQHGNRFWEAYFTHLFKITWPDFVEAFEHFYLLGRCPVDLVQQLRLRIDPSFKHQVSRSAWQNLLQHHGRIWTVVDTMIAEVLEDIPTRIYRAAPLRPTNRSHGGCCTLTLQFSVSPEEMDPLSSAIESSSTTSPAYSPPSPLENSRSNRSPSPEDSRPAPWFPFAHSTSDDGDMAIPTPHDMRPRQGADRDDSSQGTSRAQQPVTSWDDFCRKLCDQSRPWWGSPSSGNQSDHDILEDDSAEPLRIAALRAVNSCIAYTHRALVFRVISGDLANNRPLLELPKKEESENDVAEKEVFPSLVVMANGTRFSGITKFGRTSSRRTLLPDYPMSEPIASRSHFNVIYDQEADRYRLMDAGSKWGTFVKIRKRVTLSCGDWIRVGGVEFIIHFCGGACSCSKGHAHYRLHSLRLLREHQACSKVSIPRAHPFENCHKQIAGPRGFRSACDLQHVSEIGLCKRNFSMPVLHSSSWQGGPELGEDDEREDSDPDDELPLQDELWLLLNSRRPRGWTPASARMCQRNAMPYAGPPCRALGAEQLGAGAAPSSSSSSHRRSSNSYQQVPIAPLELDFISGPRMGEKIVLCERVCTLGRGEGNTIQVNDAQLASVSRVHCIFEYSGNRWYMRDNGSTNGTWRRLSCILEPSEPIPLHQGVSIQAGVHEFMVEECEMRQSWFPSTAFASFEELCEQERHEQQQQASREADSGTDVCVRTNRSDQKSS